MTKNILKIISFLSLAMTLVPSFLVFLQKIELEQNKSLMLLGTIGWFVTAPFWIRKGSG